MDYRKRCYQSYVANHWIHFHSLSKAEFELSYKAFRKKFNQFLPADKEAKILDIACGTGHFLYYIQKEGYTYAQGIDLNDEQLNIAAKMGVKNIEKGDLFEYLPKQQQRFDMIIASDIIEHLQKEETLNMLDLIYSALKPGGKVLIATPNAASLFGAEVAFADFTHEQAFTPFSLSQVLRLSNFQKVEVYGDGPTAYDIRSSVRVLLWYIIKQFLNLFLIIEKGTGKGLWKYQNILEHRIFAIGEKRKDNEN